MEIASSAMQFLFASLQAVLACLSLVVSRKDLKVGVSLDTRGTEQYSGNRPNTIDRTPWLSGSKQSSSRNFLGYGSSAKTPTHLCSAPIGLIPYSTRLFPMPVLPASVKPQLPPFHQPTLHYGIATVKTAQLILASCLWQSVLLRTCQLSGQP